MRHFDSVRFLLEMSAGLWKITSGVALYTGTSQGLVLCIKEHNFQDLILKRTGAHSSLAVSYFLF